MTRTGRAEIRGGTLVKSYPGRMSKHSEFLNSLSPPSCQTLFRAPSHQNVVPSAVWEEDLREAASALKYHGLSFLNGLREDDIIYSPGNILASASRP